MLGKRAGLYLLVMLWVSVSVGYLCAQNRVQLDTNALIEVEDLSESLANALLEFSIAVRGGDLKTLRAFLADEVVRTSFTVGLVVALTVAIFWMWFEGATGGDLFLVMAFLALMVSTLFPGVRRVTVIA